MTTTICFSQLGSNDELVAMQKRVTIFGSALCCQFNSDSIMVLIYIVLHIKWWMGAWCHLTLTLWSLAVCSVFSYVKYKLRYATVKQVIWLWDDTEQPFRVIFLWSHVGFRNPGWVRKVSESEWDFCPSEWENLTGVTCRSIAWSITKTATS